MQISINRVDKTLPMPKYESKGAVCFDFITRQKTAIAKKSIGLIPGNVIVQIPKGYALLVVPRSSTPRKKDLFIPHGIGIIDNDYCGPCDEIQIQVYNNSRKTVIIERGERIAQGLFVKIDYAKFKEVKTNKKSSRGGFGSTQ